MILYIVIAGLVIACVEGTGVCARVPDMNITKLLSIAAVEMIFEIVGFVKIYRSNEPPRG